MIEEAQPGFDLELGARLPVFEDDVDPIRVYGGGYHFMGDKTDDVTGWRTRLVADITPSLSVGGRFQRMMSAKPGVSGGDGAVSFGSKKSFREDGLRARLDESPSAMWIS